MHKKFNTCVYSITIKLNIKNNVKPNLVEVFDNVLEHIIKHVKINKNNKVGFKIDNNVMHAPLYIEFRPIDTITGELMLSRLYRISQSNNCIEVNKFCITATVFNPKNE